MKSLKTILVAASLVTASTSLAFAQSAPGGVNGRDGNGTMSGSSGMSGESDLNGGTMAPRRGGMSATDGSDVRGTGADVRGASQTPTDPAAIGTSGRDKQTGAPKDKD